MNPLGTTSGDFFISESVCHVTEYLLLFSATRCNRFTSTKNFRAGDNVTGLTFNHLKRTMPIHDEIEFSYCGEMYDFQKEPDDGSRIKISIWRGGDNPECCYSVTVDDDENFVDELVNAKIFLDGKSIVEGADDIDVEFFT